MKIFRIEAENFGSYKHLEFEFDGKGLTLISGATGSGKSTLCDLVPWVLFGRTSKDGAADEVRSWGSEETTSVDAILHLKGTIIRIYRSRAPNDLFYVLNDEVEERRGKDLLDTQKRLNSLLGFDCDTYLNSAYFHEFCQSAQFFTTSAKGRRLITENLVDLSLATDLQEKSKEQLKTTRVSVEKAFSSYESIKSRREWLDDKVKEETVKMQNWHLNQSAKMDKVILAITEYDTTQDVLSRELINKSQVWSDRRLKHALTGTCPACGTENTLPSLKEENPFPSRIKVELNRENPYLKQLDDIVNEKNPYLNTTTAEDAKEYLFKETQKLVEALSLQQQTEELELLQDVVKDLRSAVIQNAVSSLESTTNTLLTNHFDAEIRVAFSVQDADKLEVELYKDGYNSAYTQLSKGQRQLLKLCFGIAVMKATANQHGLYFTEIFFDEATDGLDENFKAKAVGMLETLAIGHESIFLVEHSGAIKSLIDNQIHVELVNGASVIEKA